MHATQRWLASCPLYFLNEAVAALRYHLRKLVPGAA
jgi:hypothetical protein